VRHEGDIRIGLSRSELTAVREAVELTPHFDGRLEVRDTLRGAVKARRNAITLEREVAERFARRLAAVDLPTALVKVKLLRAIHDSDKVAVETGSTPGREAA
jgi:hypothetical protein